MLRTANSSDRDSILELAMASGLLAVDELESLGDVFDSSAEAGADGSVWAVEDDGAVTAVAYAEPEMMADGAWNLRMIAVHPRVQRTGLGSRLLGFVEDAIAQRGGRLLVVDTSGDPGFEGVRSFYVANGFVNEAVIRDFWHDGDDKVVFTKRVAG